MKIIERDWVQELEESKLITSAEMQFFVDRMECKQVLNAPDLAAVLCTTVNTIYALVDAGEIGCIDRGTKTQRYCVFPRSSVMKFLQARCNRG